LKVVYVSFGKVRGLCLGATGRLDDDPKEWIG
jgi:hypothetical protein